MQTTKEYTHKLLLETARRAFFKKGFKAVSMREISKLSGIGLSNIYNYYPCKDDLLADVLHPLLEAMNSMLEDHNRPEAFFFGCLYLRRISSLIHEGGNEHRKTVS